MIDVLIWAGLIGGLWLAGWTCYRAGEDSAARKYQADLATLRAQLRRQQHDLGDARHETEILRRALRTNAALYPLRGDR